MQRMALRIARGFVLAVCLFAGAQAVAADMQVSTLSVVPESPRKSRVIWKDQLRWFSWQRTSGLATDPWGNILITGTGVISGTDSEVSWVAKLTPAGDPLWLRVPDRGIGTSTQGGVRCGWQSSPRRRQYHYEV